MNGSAVASAAHPAKRTATHTPTQAVAHTVTQATTQATTQAATQAGKPAATQAVRPTASAFRLGVVHKPADQRGVVAVRQAAFAQAREFLWLDPQALAWGPDDEQATVLALWDTDGVLCATVRARVLPSAQAAQAVIEYDIEHLNLPGPLLLLSRAATHPQSQCRGANALLRVAYLSALLGTELRCVITQVYDHAPRLRVMRLAGFELTPLGHGWDSEAKAQTQPLLAWMPRERVEQGLRALMAENAAALQHTLIDLPAMVASLNAQCGARAQSNTV
jgi:hypothetical protein